MNQQQAIEEIGKALGVLTYQVEQENLSGMFSKNSLIEDLFLPVFAILYSAADLRNLNAACRNYAHLDLADGWSARLDLYQWGRDTLDKESVWDEERSISLNRW